MSIQIGGISAKMISVIGAGQIGPDILFHFARSLFRENVRFVLLDISETALFNAKQRILKKIAKGIETQNLQAEHAKKIENSIYYSLSYEDCKDSDIVLEAATENESVKDFIFKSLQLLCSDSAIFLSNSSHMQPEQIFNNVGNKSRCLVAHYFFPADRNPIVELVPSHFTSADLTRDLLRFYEMIGKVAIKVKSSYGYAIDPVFEGLCQTAIMCLEKGMGTEKQIDKVACDTLGLGVGPFTALNLTGGNPITAHGLDELGKKISPWFKTPDSLRFAVSEKRSWNTATKDENVFVPGDLQDHLQSEFLGAYFWLCSMIIDLGITNVDDLDMACQLALVIKSPFSFMNAYGLEKSLLAVKVFKEKHPEAEIPYSLVNAANSGKWKVGHIVRENLSNVAVLTIRRPSVLNALDSNVMNEILQHCMNIESDADISGAVITGYGTKAFVSGADIRELAACKTPEEGFANSQHFQSVLNYIEKMSKPVVCAYNGYAFGGGNELGMACTLRISKKNLPIAFCQPEVKLGFIPGAGATQRLPRIIGLAKAAEILRTARGVSSKEAVEIGFLYKEADKDLLAEAIDLVHLLVDGKIEIKRISKEPSMTTELIPEELNLGYFSKKIDDILCHAIYQGIKMNLAEGLKLESEMFGKCIRTQDMKIGMDTYFTKGIKENAAFIHA